MKEETLETAISGIKGATKGSIVCAASSILTGVGMTTVPIKILGFITIGSATAVNLPIVVAIGAAGALIGGVGSAYSTHRKNKKINQQFDKLLRGD